MGGSAEHIKKHMTHYYIVFISLAILTVLTVGVSYMDFGSVLITFVVGLGIASVKSSLVASIFMHLAYDKNATIIWLLVACAFFFMVLLLVPLLTESDSIGTPLVN